MCRNLVDSEEASPATAPEILLDVLMMTCVVVPRSGEDDAASGEVFTSVKNQGIEPEGGPRNTTCSAPAHKKTNLHTSTRSRGCQALNGEMKDEKSMGNCCKVVDGSDLKSLDQKQEQWRSKTI